MKIVGIAGESGTGKSTIAAYLAGRGAAHIDADQVGHDLLDQDPHVQEAVRREVGTDVFDKDGRIDRRKLGARVFDDPKLLQVYNAIIHPAIRRECSRRVDKLREHGTAFAVIDAALLLDSEMPFVFALLIALRCDREEQIRRLEAKGHYSREEIEARLRNQEHIEKSFYKADAIVDTTGEFETVTVEIDRLIDRLIGEATE